MSKFLPVPVQSYCTTYPGTDSPEVCVRRGVRFAGDMTQTAPGSPGPSEENDDSSLAVQLATANGAAWLKIAQLAEQQGEMKQAEAAYRETLRHRSSDMVALSQLASICRYQERFEEAVSYLERIREHEVHNGEVWSRTSLEPTEGRARLAAARPPSLTRARSAAGVRRDRPLPPDALAEEGAAR